MAAILSTNATPDARALPDHVADLDRPTAKCVHCGLSFHAAAGERFCCHGCETVFHLLQDTGFHQFYELKNQDPPTCPIPAQVSNETFSFCDDPEITKRFAKNENEIEFFVEGLNCSACLWLLERLPRFCSDVVLCEVNYSQSTVRVVRKPGGSFAAAARALNKIGYRPRLIDSSLATDEWRERERRMDLTRIGVAAFCAGNIMIFAVSIYGGATGRLGAQFAWLTAILATPVLTFSAWPFYRSAFGSLRIARLNLDVPIVAAIWAGVAMSAWSLLDHPQAPQVYFDSLSVLVLLLLSSRVWLKSMQRRHLDTSHLEDLLLVGTVEKLTPTGREMMSNLSVQVGDHLLIRADELIPADGHVISGTGLVQSAALTGESNAVRVQPGDAVYAGTQNLADEWQMQVSAAANDSRLARLLRDADRSAQRKPKLARTADRVGTWFVAIVLLFAFAVSAWFLQTNPAEGFSRALAFVIVTCPCVFGMAIPLSLSLAVKAAASRGIIIKNGDAIERLASIRQVIFDKTGTLTTGGSVVTDFECQPVHLELAIAATVALEVDQTHPVALALKRKFQPRARFTLVANDVKRRELGGIEGVINGEQFSIRPLAREGTCPVVRAPVTRFSRQTLLAHLAPPVFADYGLFRDDQMMARFVIGDHLRSEARGVIQALKASGREVRILSGDRAPIVSEVATRLGLDGRDCLSEASPERKNEILKEQGAYSMMVGDGANDASALAAASVGVAIRGSVDVSLRAADVYLMNGSLQSVNDLLAIASSTRFAIYRNLAFSVAFNIFAGTLALSGHMQPLWAAVLMPVSSLTVLASSVWTGHRLSVRNLQQSPTQSLSAIAKRSA